MRLTMRSGGTAYWKTGENAGYRPDDVCFRSEVERLDKLAAYEDAEEQGRMVMLPCKVGDKVRDKLSDHIFTIQIVELGPKAGTLFRCGNPGTADYVAFYDFELGERFDILSHEAAEAAQDGGQDDA